jgi:hypothetical protein
MLTQRVDDSAANELLRAADAVEDIDSHTGSPGAPAAARADSQRSCGASDGGELAEDQRSWAAGLTATQQRPGAGSSAARTSRSRPAMRPSSRLRFMSHTISG